MGNTTIIKLNDKQKTFCEEYIIDFNGTRAAIAAGYSENGARVRASDLLTKSNIQEYIKELIAKRSEKTGITAERIVNEFAKIAFSSIAYLHNTWITLKEFEELTNEQKDTIESIKTRTRTIKFNGEEAEIEEVQIKLYDKQRALENLGKHIGFYEKDNQQKSLTVHFDEVLKDA